MYLVMFYQVDYSDHSVIISEPTDFGSDENFLKYCEKVNAVRDDDGVYRYMPEEAYKNEPPLYMKPIQLHPFVSDMELEACIRFKY